MSAAIKKQKNSTKLQLKGFFLAKQKIDIEKTGKKRRVK